MEKFPVHRHGPSILRSAPTFFNAVADALMWIIAPALHYLEDFLLFGPPGSETCSQALGQALDYCTRLGAPIAETKTEGPSTVLVFLGLELDAVERTVRLPEEKLHRLQAQITVWANKKSCTKRVASSPVF